jgi:Cdc6-like AAA superfamily ATPase
MSRFSPFYPTSYPITDIGLKPFLAIDCRWKQLTNNSQNVLLYGSRGIGKTFLVRLLFEKLKSSESSVFPVVVNLSGLVCYGRDDITASFSRAVLLQVCCEVWTRLLGKRYLDLRERLDETGNEISFRTEAERTVQRIYSLLMTSQRTARKKQYESFGVTAAIKGEKGDEAEFSRQQSDVLPFEFAEFIDELNKYVLGREKKKRFVIICDEANKMPLFEQEQILERYIELFNTKQVLFLFVAGLRKWEEFVELPDCFELYVHLKGFPTLKHIRELIRKSKSSIPFEDDGVDFLFEEYVGHPRETINACSEAYDWAQARELATISRKLIIQVCSRIKYEKSEYERNKNKNT